MIVIFAVLIGGYIAIIGKLLGFRRRESHERYKKAERKVEEKKSGKKVSWEQVGDEFKGALYNVGKSLKRVTEKKGKKK